MQGFMIMNLSAPTPAAFRTDILNNRLCIDFGYKKNTGVIREVSLTKWNDKPLRFTGVIQAETSEQLAQYKSLFLTDARFDNQGMNQCRFNIMNMENLEQLKHIFARINEIEPLPVELIKEIKLACGYSPLALSLDKLKDHYKTSPELALKYIKDSDEIDRGLYNLAYLAQHGEFPNASTGEVAHEGSGGAAASLEKDDHFALQCYLDLPQDSKYFKEANYHAASILLAHLDEYQGLDREESLKQLMNCAYTSGDFSLIGQAFGVCAGQNLSQAIAADNMGEFLYQLAVHQRTAHPSVHPTATPLASAMAAAGGAGVASSAEVPKP